MKFTGTLKIQTRTQTSCGHTLTIAHATDGTFDTKFKMPLRRIMFLQG